MNKPVSLPQELPQPTTPRYDLTALYLFTLYPTRDAYRTAFSAEPPAYEPTKPSKSWFDTSAGAGSYQYYGSDLLSHSFTLSPADAAAVNLWGPLVYPVYTPAPTEATRSGVPMPPTTLSTKDQADALAAAWKMPTIDETTVNFSNDTYPADETRRPWALVIGISDFYVGEQLAIQNADGIGAPGHWDLSGTFPQWVSDIPVLPATPNPEGPIPMRLLKADEQFTTGGMMDPGPYIELIPAAPATPAASVGGLTDAQVLQLQRIEDGVNAIAQRFGIS
jgi:hypothetical protein